MTNEEIQRALLAYQGQPQGMQPMPMQAPELAQVDQAMQTLDMQPPPQPTAPTPAAPVNPYQQLGQAITESSNAQQQALEAQQQAIAQASIDRDIATEGRAMELEQEAAANQQRQQAYQAEQSARMKEAQAFLKQADQPITDRRTIGNKVAGAIAIALSGMGDAIAAKGGNRNTGHMQRTMSLIDEQVNRDIMIQRENLANKRAAAGAKFTEMGIAQSMFQDQERAVQFGSSLRKEAYADEMLRIAQNVQDAEKASALTQQGETIKQNEKVQRFQLAQAELEDQRRRSAAAAAQQAAEAKAMRQAALAEVNDVEELINIGTPEAYEKAAKLVSIDKERASADKDRAAAEKDRTEGVAGPNGRKLNEGEAKIFRAAPGTASDRRRLQGYLENDDIPWMGARGVSEALLPSRLASGEGASYLNALDQISDVVLRDKSGAVISDSEIEREIKDAKSGDDERAKKAIARLLERYDSRVRAVGLDPISGKPIGERAGLAVNFVPDGQPGQTAPAPQADSQNFVNRRPDIAAAIERYRGGR